MKRGFTIVEVLVVIAVLAILVTVSAFAFMTAQKRSLDGEARSFAAIIRHGAEKYYTANGEYPLASAVNGTAITGSPPASYATASSVLGVPLPTLNSSNLKLVACGATQSLCKTNNLVDTRVYYFTKASQSSTAAEAITTTTGGTDCTYTFPASQRGALAYIVAYYSAVDGNWKITKSDTGVVDTNNGLCMFTTL